MGQNTAKGAGIGLAVGLALAPFTAGTSLAAMAAMGTAAGAEVGGVKDINAQSAVGRKMQAEMNNVMNASKKPTPVIPTQDMASISAAKQMRSIQLAQRSGKASTFLTDTTDKFGG